MFKALESSGPLSRFGRDLAIWSAILTVVFSAADSVMRGMVHTYEHDPISVAIWGTLAYDLKYFSQQLIYVGALLFIGAKFFETRTILTVGFANLDKDKMRLRGPDDENVVWVGQRYGTRLEAEAMASALQSRLEAEAGQSTQ